MWKYCKERFINSCGHECPYCGFSCDRDYNASRNILFSGMETARSVHRVKPSTSHISDASFGDEVGSCVL
ncbi:MAG: transposase [Methanotrichaceae archaeon]|nr:transposase [Methanotrichaceae archaeon]